MEQVWIQILEIIAAPLGLILGALATVWVSVIKINGEKLIAAKLKVSQDELAHVQAICRASMLSAGQMYKSGQITDRKAFAMDMALKMRDADKLTTPDSMIAHLIETEIGDPDNAPTPATTVVPVVPTAPDTIPG